MKKVLDINEAIKTAKKLRSKNKSIVVAGGFFDILHEGHIRFIKNSKKYGDYLFILLEDDNKARLTKGPKRPINFQKDRATILSSLQNVDYIVLLKDMTTNHQYDKIIFQISPSVIATTSNDPNIHHKQRQAKLVNGKVVRVIPRIFDYSTTQLIKSINH